MTNLFVNHTEIIVFGRFLEEKKEDIDEIIKRMEKTISVINSGMGSDAWAGVDANVFKENMENHIRELKIMSGRSTFNLNSQLLLSISHPCTNDIAARIVGIVVFIITTTSGKTQCCNHHCKHHQY